VEGKVKILGIAGSLRQGSYNRALLRAAAELLPEGAGLTIFDLEGIPPFNQDLLASMPERVKALKAAVRAADAVLFATPEYNYSVPGVLKNAFDWGTRPMEDNCWVRKPAAIMGASTGRMGTVRAQMHLRQCFIYMDMPVVNKPEVMVSMAADKFDAEGKLIDEETRKLVAQLVESLVELARRG